MTAPRSVQQLFDLTGKTALITGGSRGLGLQMAHALGEAGAKVVISSRKAADLEQAVILVRAVVVHRCGVSTGLSDDNSVRSPEIRSGESGVLEQFDKFGSSDRSGPVVS